MLITVGFLAQGLARQWFPAARVLDRLLIGLLVFVCWAVLAVRALGLVGAFTSSAVLTLLVGSSALAALSTTGWRDIPRGWHEAIKAFRGERPVLAAWLLTYASVAIAVSAWHAWWFPNWSWDVSWYHEPMAMFAIQGQSTAVVETNNYYINAYPKNLELFSALLMQLWGARGVGDFAQLPFVFVGALAVAAWCRRVGGSRTMAVVFAASWTLTPALALQLHTTHADVAFAALFLACGYFVTDPQLGVRHALFATVIGGLALGTKISGVLLLALLAPWWLRAAWVCARHRSSGALLGALTLALACGGHSYLRNVWAWGNPFYPAAVHLPVIGDLAGVQAVGDIAGGQAFFADDGAVKRWLENLIIFQRPGDIVPHLWPDIRHGGLGELFPALLLPAVAIASLSLPFWRGRRLLLLGPISLFVIAHAVPASWWPRLVLSSVGTGLVCLCAVAQVRALRVFEPVIIAVVTVLSVHSWLAVLDGYRVVPAVVASPSTRQAEADLLRARVPWLWPRSAVDLREALPPGALVATDGTQLFLGEYWKSDLTSRVQVVPFRDASSFRSALRASRPQWVSVAKQSPAEQVVHELGGRYLFDEAQPTAMYALSWEAVRPPRQRGEESPRQRSPRRRHLGTARAPAVPVHGMTSSPAPAARRGS